MTTVRGSCLCGEVAFEVDGPFDRFLNCHCSRCRKATGTAHSCEVIVEASALRWLRGAASVMRFDLPTARSFATAFCGRRGSPMPHLRSATSFNPPFMITVTIGELHTVAPSATLASSLFIPPLK
jgi:hypothetical protein